MIPFLTNFDFAKTEKPKYVAGETIAIIGNVGTVIPGQPVLIQIFTPKEAYNFDQIANIAADGSYTYSLVVGGPRGVTGTYRVVASYAGQQQVEMIFEFIAQSIGNKVIIITTSGQVSSLDRSSFEPSPLTLISGNTVTFINEDTKVHNLVSGDVATLTPDGRFDTGLIPAGKPRTITIQHSGNIPFFCNLHPNETGVMIVEPSQRTKEEEAIPEHMPISETVVTNVISDTK